MVNQVGKETKTIAVGNIDLSRVNISLAEFQKMSDGKYNAGEVKLSSETGRCDFK